MKIIVVLFWVFVLLLIAIPVSAQDAVVVIPLNSSKGGPGDWKIVSVSSLGGIPRDSAVRTGVQLNPNCGEKGRYANQAIGYEYLTVPIQLPDGATIVSFTGLICDTTASHRGEIILFRSDSLQIAYVSTGVSETSTTTLSKTDVTITAGTEIVDNSKYSYYIYMNIHGTAGSALYPVRGIVTLQ